MTIVNAHAQYVAALEADLASLKEKMEAAKKTKAEAEAAIKEAERAEIEAAKEAEPVRAQLDAVRAFKAPAKVAVKKATAAKTTAAKKPASKKAAAKKPAAAPKAKPAAKIDPNAKGAKTAFIRANPTMGVTALVQKAAEHGIQMSKALVYATRDGDRKKAEAKSAAKKPASKKAAPAKPAPKAKKPAPEKKAAPKKAASKTADRGGKSAFIRSLPADTPIAEVVKLAKKNGTPVSKALIYAVRKEVREAAAKKPASKKAEPAKPAPAKKAAKKPASKRAAKPAAAKGAASKAKKPTRGEVKEKAAEGRRAVARGERPPMRLGMAIVMGDKTMNAQQVVDGLKKKGWAPESDDPKGYVSYMLSSNRDAFERDADKGRGYYRVKDGVDTSWTPKTKASAAAPAPAKPKPAPKAKPAAKANGKSKVTNGANGKTNGAAEAPLAAEDQSTLDNLGISEDAAPATNPFD